jgi:uncharacterized protein YkwD
MTCQSRTAKLLCALFLGLLALALPAAAGPYLDYATGLNASPPEGSRFRPDLEAELAALASAYRQDQGKEPVAANDMLQAAARAHAADMMLNGFMGHTASTGHSLQARISAFVGDVTRFPSLGENAARDTRDTPVDEAKARALFSQWVKSRTHRKVMVNRSFRYVSTGVIERGGKIWAVQIFFAEPRKKGLFQ